MIVTIEYVPTPHQNNNNIVLNISLFDITKYNTRYETSVYVLLNDSATVFRLRLPYPSYTATQCKIGEIYRVSIYQNAFFYPLFETQIPLDRLMPSMPLYISTSIWVLRISNAGQNLNF